MSGQWPCYPFHLNSISQCKASGPFIPYIWTLFLSVRSVASLSLVSERLVVSAISLSLPSGHHLSVSCQLAPLSFSSGLHLSVSGQSPFSPFHLNATSSVRPVALLSLLSGLHFSVSGQWPYSPFHPNSISQCKAGGLSVLPSQCKVSGLSIPSVWTPSLCHVCGPTIIHFH